MVVAVANKQEELRRLCEELGVESLYLFGSGALPESNTQPADLDFLVTFKAVKPGTHAEHFFSLLFGLEDLFNCKIDLLEEPALRNPYFKREVMATRVSLYASN